MTFYYFVILISCLPAEIVKMGNMNNTHTRTIKWIDDSARAGRPWFVCLDEIGPFAHGVLPDAEDPEHNQVRKEALWGNLMAGGAGVEWYFGYQHPHTDLNLEDFRSRDAMWDQTRYALEFFQKHLPFTDMVHADARTAATNDYVFADEGVAYAVYLKDGGTPVLDLGPSGAGEFRVQWYNPRAGGALLDGAVTYVIGPGMVSLGGPPSDPTADWVVLVTPAGDCETSTGCGDSVFRNGAE